MVALYQLFTGFISLFRSFSCCNSVSALAPVAKFGIKSFDDNRSKLFFFVGLINLLGLALSIVSLVGGSDDYDIMENASWYTYTDNSDDAGLIT